MSQFQYQNPNPGAYPNPYQQQPKKKVWPVLLAIGIPLLFLTGVIIAVVILMNDGFSLSGASTTRPDLPTTDYIGVLHVEGTISPTYIDGYDHEWTMEEIERLQEDEANVGLLLYIDSPGGTIYETDELYLAIEAYKEETGRPVYAYGGSYMASGGYYLAATAETILCNRNCWTGSIGVTAGTVIDISGFLADLNIKTTDIVSGKNKAMGGYFSELTHEQQAIFQSLIDEAYDQFTAIVAEGRGFDLSYVESLADGRVYTAKQALGNGLIDGIGTLDDLKDAIDEDFGYTPEYADLEYSYSYSIYDYLWMTTGQRDRLVVSDLSAAVSLLDRFSRTPSYLLETFGR